VTKRIELKKKNLFHFTEIDGLGSLKGRIKGRYDLKTNLGYAGLYFVLECFSLKSQGVQRNCEFFETARQASSYET
jgi:hypothetical protein